MQPTYRPEYLIAGHTTRDLLPDGWRIGGSVAYAALGASEAGRTISVVTGAGPEIRSLNVFGRTNAVIQDSLRTTTFRNVEQDGVRTQFVYELGEPLDSALVRTELLTAGIFHLAPIFGEIDHEFIRSFNAELTGASLQGWMRVRDGEIVRQGLSKSWDAIHPFIDVAIYSVHDLKYDIISERIHPVIPCCVETMGKGGVRIVEGKKHHIVSTAPLDLVDSNGAGDLFAYEFLTRFRESGHTVSAAKAANEFVARCLKKPGFRRPLYPQMS